MTYSKNSEPKASSNPANSRGIGRQFKHWNAIENVFEFQFHIQNLKILGLIVAIFGATFSVSACGIGLGFYCCGLIAQLTVGCKNYDWRPYPMSWFLVPLLCSLIISLFISDYMYTSTRGLIKYLQGFAFLYACVDAVRTKRQMRLILCAFIVCYITAAFAAVTQDLIGFDLIYWREPIVHRLEYSFRVTGPFKHPNDFAAFLVPGILMATGLFVYQCGRRTKTHKSIASAYVFLILAYCLVLTQSRGGILALFAGFLTFFLFFKIRWILLGGLGAVVTAVLMIPSPLAYRLRELSSISSDAFYERFYLIDSAIGMVKASPYFGLGLNTYSLWFPKFYPQNGENQVLMYTHNSYLQMATESGVIGIFFYLLFVVAFIVWVSKSIRTHHDTFHRIMAISVLSSIVALLANGLFESFLQSTQLRTLFWILMGIAASLVMNADSLAKAEDKK